MSRPLLSLLCTRTFALGLVAAAATALAAPAAYAQQLVRISAASIDTDALSKSLVTFKDTLEKSAPGRFDVKVYPASTLFKQGTEVPAMQRGNLEMSTMTTFEVEQQIPEFAVFSTGYLFRDYGHMKAVFSSPIGAEYYKKVEEVMGIKILQPFYLGTRQVNLRKARDVKGPDDLKGVKLRVPGGPGWLALARGLGVSPTPMAMPEVYLALSTGTIDGQENPLSIMRANKLEEVTQQIVLTSHLVQPVFLAMALPIWNKLSADDQAKALAAARVAAEANDKARIAEEKSIVDELQAKGLKIARPDTALFRKAVMAQYESSGLKAKWPAGMYERIDQVK
ncbi:C4-dicarboxylate ABC transporter [Pigmentiphaga litoralis]|uniref:DctP family TRAP transporter solute-binding subunit n=1 Tax=Pigmentiphaga litoralis TaxID=516702 RepID=UPI001673745F|nr:DctP family TRAP transporter solute-binding subunit [Pigmentiphaga litoralis]GGX10195.1 C4-dicarboxylate ABC transporter [Pigmentiphaga litoralis]